MALQGIWITIIHLSGMLIFEGQELSLIFFIFFCQFNMRIFRDDFEKANVHEVFNQKVIKTVIKISLLEIIILGLWSVFSIKDLQLLLSYP